MKKNFTVQFLSIVLLAIVFTSCNKNSDDQTDNFSSNYISTTLTGIVFDENHIPLAGAMVQAHNHIKYTDPNGLFVFKDLVVPKSRCYVAIQMDHYFSVMRSKQPIKNGTTRLDAHLIDHSGPNSQLDVFTTGTEYTVNLPDGSSIHFPTGTGFESTFRSTYNGNVNIRTSVLNATNEDYSRRSPSGDQSGIDDGEAVYLDTRTGFMVELSDDNGHPLNLAANYTANISAQIPAALLGSAPQTIPVYYAASGGPNTSREGEAEKNGSTYEHSVGHFSFWSTQLASPDFGNLTCRVIDASGQTLTGVRVQVGNAYGITDENGQFSLKVPALTDLEIAVRPLDFYGFSVTANTLEINNGEDVFVELQLPNDLDRVLGTLKGCNLEGLEGMIALRWGSTISSFYTKNGTFDLPFKANSGPYQLYFTSETLDTNFTIELNTGINNLEDVSICATDLPEFINTIRIDSAGTGTILNYSNFYQSTEAYYIDESSVGSSSPHTTINIKGLDGQILINVDIVNSIGNVPLNSNNNCTFTTQDGYIYHPEMESGSISILQYGAVGEMIKGSVDGITSENDIIHIEFKVLRAEDILGQ